MQQFEDTLESLQDNSAFNKSKAALKVKNTNCATIICGTYPARKVVSIINNLRDSAIQSEEIIFILRERQCRSLSCNNDFCQ